MEYVFGSRAVQIAAFPAVSACDKTKPTAIW